MTTHINPRFQLKERNLWEQLHWRIPQRPTVRILVVVDGWVRLGTDDGFGVGKIIEILRKNTPHDDPGFGFVNFEIETATRDAAPLSGTANYNSFRFDQMAGSRPLINRFHQIWCFGFHPGNTNPSNPDDAPIESQATVLSQGELRFLITWMNDRRGGMLAMGDHHYLGATMCWKIPRVRAMRRWTNQDGVPPIDTPVTSPGGVARYRHDTNQPQNAIQADPASTGPTAIIPISAETDGIPQKIKVRNFGRRYFERPHAILCSREYDVIDVLPDHPHEGWVYEDHEVKKDLTYDFGNKVKGADFPDAQDGGRLPAPQVIAWAKPFPKPPYDHQKSDTKPPSDPAKPDAEEKKFAVIGVYDGHRANVGRVVVDSTWHHWFNMNLDGIQYEAESSGTAEALANWGKIKTYFRNVAVWLSPPAKQHSMLTYAAFWSLGSSLAVEDYDGGMPAWEIGETARDILGQFVSHCLTSDWVLPYVPIDLSEHFRIPVPDECLTCPPWPLIEDAVLGGIIKEMLPERERLISERLRGKEASVKVEKLVDAIQKGAATGLSELRSYWDKQLNHAKKSLAEFQSPSGAANRKLEADLQEVRDDLKLTKHKK